MLTDEQLARLTVSANRIEREVREAVGHDGTDDEARNLLRQIVAVRQQFERSIVARATREAAAADAVVR